MTMETVESQQDDNAVDSMSDRDAVHNRSQPDKREISSVSQVSWNMESWEESIKWHPELLWFFIVDCKKIQLQVLMFYKSCN